jgi:predicted ATPase/class 3 adenylate cyclase
VSVGRSPAGGVGALKAFVRSTAAAANHRVASATGHALRPRRRPLRTKLDVGESTRFTWVVRELPTGTVTFVFTDIEASTRLLHELGERYSEVLAEHRRVLREAFARHSGNEVDTQGDAFFVAFSRASAAVEAAVEAQVELRDGPVRVRMGVHTGEPILTEEGYVGMDVHRAARIAAVGHGGQVLLSQSTRDLLRDEFLPGATLQDLGPQWLKDLDEPERLYQVLAPGLVRAFPPLRSLGTHRGNLPLQMSSFIGRKEELAVVTEALENARLVTLTGVGGVGKTRLAIQVAGEIEPRFGDGAWFIDLASVRASDAVAEMVAMTFALAARPGSTLTETLVEFLRTKRLLLVLDNCEHVLDVAAELARTLVRGCPTLAVLTTSREALGVEGEQVVQVPSLSAPNADADLDAVARSDAVGLFADRALAVKPGFEITAANATAIATVCQRLDGIPLALELAAARAAILSPEELASRLDQRLRVLTGGRRGVAERHQTLRSAIDWSYELLSPPEQRLLTRLAVFAGGCSLPAVEAVCCGGVVEADVLLSLVANLVARSLVVADEQNGEMRYRLLETIREYAEERLESAGDVQEIRERHARYYATWTEDATQGLRGPEEAAWTRRVASEQENLRAAMTHALDTDDANVALRLLAAAKLIPMYFLPVTAVLSAAAERALELSGARDHSLSVAALVQAATSAWSRGDFERTERFCEEASAAEQRLGTRPDVYILGVRAFAEIGAGRIEDAIEIWSQCLPIDRANGDTLELAGDLSMLAYYRALHGDCDAAIAEATAALAQARRCGNPTIIAVCLGNLGFVLADAEPERARDLLRESIDLSASLGRPDAQAYGLLAMIAARRGDAREAVELAAQALDLQFWFADRISLGAILGILAHALAEDMPECAAVLEAACETLDTGYASFEQIANLRDETTLKLSESLGEDRLEQLRVQGNVMDEERAVDYARDAIARALNLA